MTRVYHGAAANIVNSYSTARMLEQLGVERSGITVVHPGVDVDRFHPGNQSCDIFLMPNRVDGGDVEGFGIVFLEAAATERPSIGGRSGGVPEAVADGETGILVGGADVDELGAAIRDLAESPDRRLVMGRTGRARVCRDFTWTRAAQQVESLHAAVAANAWGPGR